MTDSRSQSNYQLRLGWGIGAFEQLAPADIVVIVDAISGAASAEPGSADSEHSKYSADLATRAAGLVHTPTVFAASLRNARATAQAIVDEQVIRGGRTAINLVLAGDDGHFAVEDYLAAGALGDALSSLGLDHTAPDLAVAIEGFRPLTRALKHLLSASASGLTLAAAGRRDEVKVAAELNVDAAAIRTDS